MAKLTIANPLIVVLVKANHEQGNLIVCDLKTQCLKPVDDVSDTCESTARLSEDTEGVN